MIEFLNFWAGNIKSAIISLMYNENKIGGLDMLPNSYCNIRYNDNIKHWDDGLPLGNGDIGCLIWGNGNQLRFSIDKGNLWDCSGAVKPEGDFTYKSLQKFVAQKRKRKISKVFDLPYANPTPTKLPAGKILIELKRKNIDCAELDIASAHAEIKAKDIRIESFVHAEKPLGFIRSNTPINIMIENPAYGDIDKKRKLKSKTGITQSLKNIQYEKAKTGLLCLNNIEYKYFTQKVNDTLTYGIFIATLENEAVYTVSLAINAKDAINNAVHILTDAMNQGYEENFKEHQTWWDNFWSESFIHLDDKYFEKKWYRTNYLLGSCSRAGFAPMPLQGVWTADNGQLPPWKGDYHFDLNIQLCYLSYLKANHISCGKSYIDFLLDNEKKAEEFARKFFDADGLCLPSVMDINGNALAGWAMYALSPANQAWLCHGIKEYCDYTGDDEFLENRAYPYMKKYGEFLLSIMRKDKNGKLVLPLSSSPETHDNRLSAWLKPNSNYDNAMMIRHFKNLLETAEKLKRTDDINKWQSTLDHLQELSVDKDHVLMLSANERQKHSHRHFSHLISIYPLGLLKYDKNKKIIDASVANLEKLGTKQYCGYSFAWLANLQAIQKKGNETAKTLKTFWENFCLSNTFHVNGDYKITSKSIITYRLFSLEGNFCAVDALQNMLIQCNKNMIELFPAIPDCWQNISFDLLATGNIKVHAVLENGELQTAKLLSKSDKKIKVIYKNKEIPVELTKNEVKAVSF